MTSKQHNVVFIDSSAFKAFLDSSDDFYQTATKILENLVNEGAVLATSNFIIDECATMMRYKSDKKTAFIFRKYLMESKENIKVLRVQVQDESNAWEWFKKDWGKLSFTDCVTFAQLKRLGIERVFTFDKHFERAGFKLFN